MRWMAARWLAALGVSAAALCAGMAPGHAAFSTAPWCAVLEMGQGDVYWDCQYQSIEQCRPNVIAGNRGFCNMNPAWPGFYKSEARPKVRHRHHVRRD